MTKEEIIEFCEMKAELEAENEDIYEAIIKVLEQADVLDNIKDEIEEIQIIGHATVDGKLDIASRAVMRIIDKYKEKARDKK